MVEAMVALTIADALMCQVAQCEIFPNENAERPNPMGSNVSVAGYDATTAQAAVSSGPISQRVDEE